MNTNGNTETLGSHPCNKPCVYCKLLSKTETDHFTSVSTGQSYKIGQSINCQSKNVIYVVKCVKCNLQGVGHSKKRSKRISHYFSHIKQKHRTCSIWNIYIICETLQFLRIYTYILMTRDEFLTAYTYLLKTDRRRTLESQLVSGQLAEHRPWSH